jgi:patatin-like phospholipase/acyl hydrolase
MSAQMFGGIQKSTFDKTKATLTKAKNLLTTGAQYNPEVLEKFANELYENITLSQAVKPVFIATFDLNSETTQILSTPLAKKTKLFDFKMADIARATSAAPFYFPVHPLEFTNNEKGTGLKMQLIDGGVGSNNPTLIGMMDVTKEYCTVPAYEVLSLGTGTAKHHFEKEDMGQKGSPFLMLKPTIKGFMSAQTQNAHEMTKEFLNVLDSFNKKQQNHYTRLQVSLAEEDKKLDDVREQTTENLSKNAQKIINSSQYIQVKERLKQQLCDEGIYKQENMHEKMCRGG